MLFHQDTNDEPAENLLEHIQAERAQNAGSSQTGKIKKSKKRTTLALS
jgi:hypothetical protein